MKQHHLKAYLNTNDWCLAKATSLEDTLGGNSTDPKISSWLLRQPLFIASINSGQCPRKPCIKIIYFLSFMKFPLLPGGKNSAQRRLWKTLSYIGSLPGVSVLLWSGLFVGGEGC